MVPTEEQLLSNINFFSEEVDMPILEEHRITAWIQKTISTEEKTYQGINIIFCNDEFLLRLNNKHLHHDYYTDIITFQYQEDPVEGELFISLDRVKENAEQQAVSYIEELHRVIIHGILHLIGYGDKTDEEIKIIRAKEDHYLQVLS